MGAGSCLSSDSCCCPGRRLPTRSCGAQDATSRASSGSSWCSRSWSTWARTGAASELEQSARRAGPDLMASTTQPNSRRLPLVLAAAMFVLVVDTSLMNVSIAAVVDDLDTKVSSVQSAIALEALVSAAFILISSKIGDLFGRKRAYVLGLLGYAIGAVAMTLAQSLTAIIVFWALI